MTTGPHEPVGGGRYHEQPSRGSPGGGGGRKPPEPPRPALTASDIAEFRKSVAALQGSVDLLRAAVTESDVRPTQSQTQQQTDGSKPKRGRRETPPPGSDPALTRAERRVKIASATIALLVTIASALAAGLVSAWSYIEGYGDNRAAMAVEAEHAKTQIELQEKRIVQMLEDQKVQKTVTDDLREELATARRSRNLLELRVKYLERVRIALMQKKPVPDKPAELVEAEKQAGVIVP